MVLPPAAFVFGRLSEWGVAAAERSFMSKVGSKMFHRAVGAMGWQRYFSAALAAILLLSTAAPSEARVNLKPGYNSFSPEQDVELGRQAAVEAERELSLVNDPQLNDYINRLGQRLASYAPGTKFPYTF